MNRLSITVQVGITTAVYLMFGVDSLLLLTRALPAGAHDIAKDMLSGLLVLVTMVTNFWMQSSHSSQSKDGTIGKAIDALATSTPAAATGAPP